MVVDGAVLSVPEGDEKHVEVKGRKFLLGGKEFLEVTTLDPSTDPKLIDLKGLVDRGDIHKGTEYEAVYRLEQDTLTHALYSGEGRRPDKFESVVGSNIALDTFERVGK